MSKWENSVSPVVHLKVHCCYTSVRKIPRIHLKKRDSKKNEVSEDSD